MPGLAILVGTRKGLFLLKSGRGRRRWSMDGPHFLGHIVHHAVLDPRDGHTLSVRQETGDEILEVAALSGG
jgi:hypothetical protein